MIIPNYFEDTTVLHIGTLPYQAYFIPAGEEDLALLSRDRSDRFFSLCGSWDFRYEPNVRLISTPWWQEDISTEGFGSITVPSCWQTQGYDRYQYTNKKYPFPFDPPYVPFENPCGIYRRSFTYKKRPGRRTQLCCEGIDSCFYLWINGRFVGYSQVAYNSSRFDVSDFLRDGENSICFFVLKWCDGSYLEDQDKFRMSGIFRQLYLLERDANCISDMRINTAITPEGAKITAALDFEAQAMTVDYRLISPDGLELCRGSFENGQLCISVDAPLLWTAETPSLYTLLFHCGSEYIARRVGIREISIDEDLVVRVNGQSVCFNGMNRHDSDPITGACCSMEQVERDLRLMKEHNINALRTSHYPPQPELLELCDSIGLYVIDEACIESHGVTELYGSDADFGLLAANEDFAAAILDRVQGMVLRDRNNPSVVIWSMGNEAGYGDNFVRALRWTKETDPSRLTHYESSIHPYKDREYDLSDLDLHSLMYPSTDEIREYLGNSPKKPLILCEYCHSMGNGPGDLEEYRDLMRAEPAFCGGFIWEWCDHAVYSPGPDGEAHYLYGGDHGEFPGDGNFCMDGMVYPDRRPHSGLLEYKQVIRPVRLVSYDGENSLFTFENMRDFLSPAEDMELEYRLEADGAVVCSGRLSGEEIHIPPHEKRCIALPLCKARGELVCVIFNWYGSVNGKRHQLCHDQAVLRSIPAVPRPVGSGEKHDFIIGEDELSFIAYSSGISCTWSKVSGMPSSLRVGDRELLSRPMELNIWRAPTDNDMYIRKEWTDAGYDRSIVRVKDFIWRQNDGYMEVRVRLSLGAVYLQNILEAELVWYLECDGRLSLSLKAQRCMAMPWLPRLGLRFFLPAGINRADYLGFGPHESYCDKHQASMQGYYSTTAEDNFEHYLFPQENSSHFGCTRLCVSGEGSSLSFTAAAPFSFSFCRYTQEELCSKAHDYELEMCEDCVLCLDFEHSGVGSNSCGPELSGKYRVSASRFEAFLQLHFEKSE